MLNRYFGSDEATGAGVERGTIHHALVLASSDPEYWDDRGNYKVPRFHENTLSSPRRRTTWTSFGLLAAIHFYHLGAGPHPWCPLFMNLVFMTCQARNAAHSTPLESSSLPTLDSLTPPILAHFERDVAVRLYPWLTHDPAKPLPDDLRHPLCQYLIMEAERNVWVV